jgi:hypothetical protein
MKSMRFVCLVAAASVAALVLTGCNGLTPKAETEHRIQEKGDFFTKLTEHQQNDILGGAVERGNTPDMVYMALGKPTKVVTSADGQRAMWVYIEYYSHKGAVSTGLNSPNSSHYTPGLVAANTPYNGDPNGPKWQQPMAFGTAGTLGPVQMLELPDMLTKTVYIFFHGGKVAEIKLDGDASDQQGAAANAAPPGKNTRTDLSGRST